MNICVFLSSSDAVAPEYVALAEDLGKAIASHGHTLVFGGNNTGLMGRLADAVKDNGERSSASFHRNWPTWAAVTSAVTNWW